MKGPTYGAVAEELLNRQGARVASQAKRTKPTQELGLGEEELDREGGHGSDLA